MNIKSFVVLILYATFVKCQSAAKDADDVRIVNGTEAEENEFPFVVCANYKYQQICHYDIK